MPSHALEHLGMPCRSSEKQQHACSPIAGRPTISVLMSNGLGRQLKTRKTLQTSIHALLTSTGGGKGCWRTRTLPVKCSQQRRIESMSLQVKHVLALSECRKSTHCFAKRGRGRIYWRLCQLPQPRFSSAFRAKPGQKQPVGVAILRSRAVLAFNKPEGFKIPLLAGIWARPFASNYICRICQSSYMQDLQINSCLDPKLMQKNSAKPVSMAKQLLFYIL